jgi:hypothetical protein
MAQVDINAFLTADVDELVNKLKLDERILLLSAPSWWSTHGTFLP